MKVYIYAKVDTNKSYCVYFEVTSNPDIADIMNEKAIQTLKSSINKENPHWTKYVNSQIRKINKVVEKVTA